MDCVGDLRVYRVGQSNMDSLAGMVGSEIFQDEEYMISHAPWLVCLNSRPGSIH